MPCLIAKHRNFDRKMSVDEAVEDMITTTSASDGRSREEVHTWLLARLIHKLGQRGILDATEIESLLDGDYTVEEIGRMRGAPL